MLGQPLLNFCMLVRGVVVCNQMQCFVLGRVAVYMLEKLQLLDMTMTLLELCNHLAVHHVQRRKERGCAIAFVVVCHGGGTPLLYR